MNRLHAISYFPAVLSYKFGYVKSCNTLNVTSGNSPEILTNRRGDGLFIACRLATRVAEGSTAVQH